VEILDQLEQAEVPVRLVPLGRVEQLVHLEFQEALVQLERMASLVLREAPELQVSKGKQAQSVQLAF